MDAKFEDWKKKVLNNIHCILLLEGDISENYLDTVLNNAYLLGKIARTDEEIEKTKKETADIKGR